MRSLKWTIPLSVLIWLAVVALVRAEMPERSWFEQFERKNGCCYAYVECTTEQLQITIPPGAHPWGAYEVVTDGVTNTVQKTIAQFVTIVRYIDGGAVAKLCARDPSLPSGRKLPLTVDDLMEWWPFLEPYGLTNWMGQVSFDEKYSPASDVPSLKELQ